MTDGQNKHVVKIYLGSPFKPKVRLGATLFKSLVSLKGVEYRRGQGFIITDFSAIPRINTLLNRFNVMVVPYGKCVICGKDVHCEQCEYRDLCRKDVDICVCRSCLEQHNIWSKYTHSQKGIIKT